MCWCSGKRRYFPDRPGPPSYPCRFCENLSCELSVLPAGLDPTAALESGDPTSGGSVGRATDAGGNGNAISVGDVPAHPRVLETLPRLTMANIGKCMKQWSGSTRTQQFYSAENCVCAICSDDMAVLHWHFLRHKRRGDSITGDSGDSNTDISTSSDSTSGKTQAGKRRRIQAGSTSSSSNSSTSSSSSTYTGEEAGTEMGEPLLFLEPTCRHIFHASCLGKWLETKGQCPVCRLPVDAALYTAQQAASQGCR